MRGTGPCTGPASGLTRKRRLLLAALIGSVGIVVATASVSAQASGDEWYLTQAIEAEGLGISNPVGLAYSGETDVLFSLPAAGPSASASDFLRMTPDGDVLGAGSLAVGAPDPLLVAYYGPTQSLFHLDAVAGELVGVPVGSRGDRAPGDQSVARTNISALGLREVVGITFDASRRHLYVLDVGSPAPSLVRVSADAQHAFDGASRPGRVRRTRLTALKDTELRGIAFDPQTEHLFMLAVDESSLHELTTDGELVSTRNLTSLGLQSPGGIVFAASADSTDDPTNTTLFVADSGGQAGTAQDGGTSSRFTAASGTANGQIVELSFRTAAAPTSLKSASLLQVIDTSKAVWSPSSPDPTGIAFRPSTSGLIISDSEVEENHPDFQGFNVFESSTGGSLLATCATTGFSTEPTGAAVNPSNGFVYFSDDNADAVFEVDLGPDGTYCTADDSTSSLSTSTFGSGDPEGLAFGDNKLFISDGVDQEVYVVDLGADGVIGGGGTDADTLQSQFDTFALGLRDPEGVEFDASTASLFLVSTIGTDDFLVKSTTGGTALESYDLSFLGSVPRSGLAYGPDSQTASFNAIYLSSRGVDNGADPNENDGKVYEISIGTAPPPPPTAAFTGTPTTGAAPLTVNFTDQSTGTPTTWNWDFGDTTTSTQQNPTHTYTTPGTYTITLTVTNTTGTDTTTNTNYITVTTPPPPPPEAFYASFASNGSVDGINFNDEDILWYDGTTWTLLFDGSDVGVGGEDVDGFVIVDADTILMSFTNDAIAGGLTVQDHDIVEFTATSLGQTTAGSFALYFDGEDVELTSTGEDIDAIDVLPDGRILVSTNGSPTVTGVNGAKDEDILAFTPASLGDTTAGTWAMYFDSSDTDLNLTSGTDVNAVDVAANGDIFVSTDNTVAVGGVNSEDEDIAFCAPSSLGANTVCSFGPSLFFDGSQWALGLNDLDGISIPGAPSVPPPPTAAFTGTPTTGAAPLTVNFTDQSTGTPTTWNWDFGDTTTSTQQNPTHTYTTPGTYTITLTVTNTTGTDTTTNTNYITVTTPPPPPPEAFYASFASNGSVDGINFNDEDILWYDGTTWTLLFDGSDVGVTGDLSGFHIIDDNQILMSFSKDNIFGGVTVQDHDIALFTATTLGDNTSGNFSLFFDGDAADLSTAGEDIDAISLLPDGSLIISTSGTPSVTGVGDAKDEDLLEFSPSVPGDYSAGTWQMFFDASDVGIAGGSDIVAVSIDSLGDLYLSTDSTVLVGTVIAEDEDVVVCETPTAGSDSGCSATSLFVNGSAWALESNDIDGLGLP